MTNSRPVQLIVVTVLTGILCLTMAVWWGPYPIDPVFTLFQESRQVNLADYFSLSQPAYLLLLHFLADTDLSAAALLLNGFGWWLAAIGLGKIVALETNLQPVPLWVTLSALIMLTLHPAQFTAAGMGLSWVVAAALFLILATSERSWWRNAIFALAALAAWFDWTTIVLLILLAIWLFRSSAGSYKAAGTVLTLAIMALLYQYLRGEFIITQSVRLSLLQSTLQQYLHESDLYWLLLPLLAVGLWAGRRSPKLWLWLIWSAVVTLRSPSLASLLWAVGTVWLTILACLEIIAWLRTQKYFIVDGKAIVLLFAYIVISLAVANLMSLHDRWLLRPVSLYEAEEVAANYVLTEGIQLSTFAGSARLGYLINLPARPLPEADQFGRNLLLLAREPADLLAAPTSIWQQEFANTAWLKEQYHPLQPLNSLQSEIALFRKTSHATEAALVHPLTVTTTFGLSLSTVQYTPAVIRAGDSVEIQLSWSVNGPAFPFGTVLNLTHPIDGTPYAQIDEITPANLSTGWLEESDQFSTFYTFKTVDEILPGAYPLTLLLHKPGSIRPELLRRAGESNDLDRVVLGYVTIPWEGNSIGEELMISFADGPLLNQAEVSGEFQPGSRINVSLFWSALTTPSENYTIFVHLLDKEGNYLVGADGVPLDGRFPTRGWQPGTIIPSFHTLQLPDSLASGQYQISVGLYDPATGIRLQRLDTSGNPVAGEQAFQLRQYIYP